MSGFNTKEKNNYGEYEIAFYTDNHEDFKKVQDLCRELIDHDKPVSTEGDLISRSALKKAIFEYCRNEKEILYHYLYYKNIITLIDNAPTVAVDCKDCDGYEAGYSAGLKDAERPQGEWILNKDENPECPFCHHSFTYWGNFCGNCGADMRKGGAEE